MTRLPLPDGKLYIDIKERITMGDKEDIHSYANDGVATDGQTYKLSPTKFRTGTVAARVMAWNIEEETIQRKDGQTQIEMKLIPWDKTLSFKQRLQVLRRLDAELVEAMYDQIDAFDDRQAVARAYATETQQNLELGSIEAGSGSNLPSVK
jgi:hypothetical protein